jgi:hypothetical protein
VKTFEAARVPEHETSDLDIARAVINSIASARSIKPPYPGMQVTLPAWLADQDVMCWGAVELGSMRERLLAGAGNRKAQGAWYTPDAVALPMSRLSLDLAIDRIIKPAQPHEILRVTAYDPACGCGVFLVAAARHLAARWVTLACGPLPAEALRAATAMVLPDVMRECVFGVDRDPVAVEISRAVLWLETGATEPFGFMDRNVTEGNSLAGDEPPALTEKHGATAHPGGGT